MRFWLFSALFVGCTPSGVTLDGRPVSSFARAAERAIPGSSIVLDAGTLHEAGVVLPDEVTVSGAATLFVSEPTRLIVAEDLTLDGLTLVGGQADEGASVLARTLTLQDVELSDAVGATAVQTTGDLFVDGSTVVHPSGIAIAIRSPTGRAAHGELLHSTVEGHLELAADTLVVDDLAGRPDVTANGIDVSLQDAALGDLDLLSTSSQLIGVDLETGARLRGNDATLLDLRGGPLQLELHELTAADLTVEALGGVIDRADLADVHTPYLHLEGGRRIDIAHVESPWIRLWADQVYASDLTGHELELWGLGFQERITLTGPRPRLRAGLGQLGAVVIESTSDAVDVHLDAASVDGLVVVEPLSATAEVLVDTRSYCILENVSWIGGTRAALSPAAPVSLRHSLLHVLQLGVVEQDTDLTGTVAWSLTEDLTPVYGLTVDLPGFLDLTGPELAPDSPYLDRGAFAGLYGPQVQELWASVSR